jgi:cytoskeletal protein CcmA (bactofilin family)
MKKLLISFLALACPVAGWAIEIKAGDNVTITKPVRDDLYVAGGTVVINSPIYGDLIVTGGTVTLNDTVTFDVIAAGGKIIINGYVADDIRMAGGELQLSGNVGGDVVVAGGTISVDKSVIINGSMLVGGGEVTMDGTVEGELRAGVGQLVLNGVVKKDADCRGGELKINGHILGKSTLAAQEIEIGDEAEFHNDVNYWNKNESLDFKKSIKNGTAKYDATLELETGQWQYLGFVSILLLLWYLGAALLTIFILQYLFSATFKKAASTALNDTLKSLGTGFLFIVTVPVAIVVSFVTIVGVPIGLILLAGYLILFMLASSITSVVVANWINNVYYSGKWGHTKLLLIAFLVFIIMKLFSLTPFIGFPITALMVCIAWGAIILNVNWKRQQAISVT